jgi:hypothetical protein
MQRLSAFLKPNTPPITIIITRCDLATPSDATLNSLLAEAQRHGLNAQIIKIASFAETGATVVPGFGIPDLISSVMKASPSVSSPFWPTHHGNKEARAILNFRKEGDLP